MITWNIYIFMMPTHHCSSPVNVLIEVGTRAVMDIKTRKVWDQIMYPMDKTDEYRHKYRHKTVWILKNEYDRSRNIAM